LRVRPTEIRLEGGVDEHGGHVTVAFNLPAGSYATVFLRELMKSEAATEGGKATNENSGSEEPSPEVEGVEIAPAAGGEDATAPHDGTDASDQ
jgi:hypothetical protein